MTIKLFIRKKYPGFFSIEQLFHEIYQRMISRVPANASVELIELPYYFSFTNLFRNILFVKKHGGIVNHVTGDAHYAILGCSRKNLKVLTIHDCVSLERFSLWDPRYWIFRLVWYDLPMRRADVITVISEKTKKDLLSKIGYGEQKLRVVSNFVHPAFVHQPFVFNTVQPTLLFIGSTANKNLDRVLSAITGLNCRLEVVGKISDKQLEIIGRNNIKVIQSFELTVTELAKKYADADLVLFPSTYEGFGMLIIEANATGRPVITSNISPLKEVAGNAACFVDPYSIEDIRYGIQRVIEDEAFRNFLIAEGIKNAERYNLDVVVDSYLSIYNEFLSRPGQHPA